MKKPSLKERILKYIRQYGGRVNGGEVERLAMANGYKASNASRRCRELQNEGSIKSEIINGSVWYSAIPKGIKTLYVEGGEVIKIPVWN